MSQTSGIKGIRPVRFRRPSGRSPGNKWYRMTLYESALADIKTTVKKGNCGANKGKRYGRLPLTDRGKAIAGLLFEILDALGIPEYRSRFSIHRLIHDELGCPAVIPVRQSGGKRGFVVHGVYRNKMLALQKDEAVWKQDYGPRAIIESTNFMVKNRTGSNIREQNKDSRECRAMMDVIAFNNDRVLDLGLEQKMLGVFQ